jgi:hypothetical protein
MMQRNTSDSLEQQVMAASSDRARGKRLLGVAAGRISLLAALVVGVALSGGCSAADCDPPIPEGARYKATLMGETPTCTMTAQDGLDCSTGCHIVDGMTMSPFEVTAGKLGSSGAQQNCSASPAQTAPTQHDIKILSCIPAESDMLGVQCQMEYPDGGCQGLVNFHFQVANLKPLNSVDWSAKTIDGLVFVIKDTVMSCIPSRSNCRDVYTARLERIN